MASLVDYLHENALLSSVYNYEVGSKLLGTVGEKTQPSSSARFHDGKLSKEEKKKRREEKEQAAKERRERIRSELVDEINKLVVMEGKNEHKFPNTLSSFHRMLIHQICEEKGFGHTSVGEGKERHLLVTFSKDETDGINGSNHNNNNGSDVVKDQEENLAEVDDGGGDVVFEENSKEISSPLTVLKKDSVSDSTTLGSSTTNMKKVDQPKKANEGRTAIENGDEEESDVQRMLRERKERIERKRQELKEKVEDTFMESKKKGHRGKGGKGNNKHSKHSSGKKGEGYVLGGSKGDEKKNKKNKR
eukprot:m.199428 g.199428  ORF g.199428 m.199428 type:complete len:304 (-) comp13697_c1_seq1:122-1033(-)